MLRVQSGARSHGKGLDAYVVAAPPLPHGIAEELEFVVGERVDAPRVGAGFGHGNIPSAQAPARRDCRQTKNQVGTWAHSLLATKSYHE